MHLNYFNLNENQYHVFNSNWGVDNYYKVLSFWNRLYLLCTTYILNFIKIEGFRFFCRGEAVSL